jgi:hypothetical protein
MGRDARSKVEKPPLFYSLDRGDIVEVVSLPKGACGYGGEFYSGNYGSSVLYKEERPYLTVGQIGIVLTDCSIYKPKNWRHRSMRVKIVETDAIVELYPQNLRYRGRCEGESWDTMKEVK